MLKNKQAETMRLIPIQLETTIYTPKSVLLTITYLTTRTTDQLFFKTIKFDNVLKAIAEVQEIRKKFSNVHVLPIRQHHFDLFTALEY